MRPCVQCPHGIPGRRWQFQQLAEGEVSHLDVFQIGVRLMGLIFLLGVDF